ncbi:MAG: hypothetical protein KDC87_17915 [Planctomycetes bacterium]|nr:hypothetical protein [Planctomycetota bacterium]MCB9869535.1 hypothetical protein [Planctomycetota bacterium]MCB9889922.1 hypothetical protein [Planctomycetota bacterium]
MKQLGGLLALFGIASIVLHFMNMELKILRWIDTWGEGPAWGIRAGLVVVGGLLFLAGGSSKSDK